LDHPAGPLELTPKAPLHDAFIANLVLALRAEAMQRSSFVPTYGESLVVALAAHVARHYGAPRVLPRDDSACGIRRHAIRLRVQL
jgi:hypothetical protein